MPIHTHQEEAGQRWGKTAAYGEYTAKTADYSREKWESLTEGMDLIMAEAARCMTDGLQAASPEAQAVVQKLQSYITEHYYRCTNEILAGLGQMYVLDERFKNNIDKHAPGTAAFLGEAIKIYCKK